MHDDALCHLLAKSFIPCLYHHTNSKVSNQFISTIALLHQTQCFTLSLALSLSLSLSHSHCPH